jgi:hypothetical protein
VKSCFIGLEVGIKTVELGVGTTKVEMGTLKALFVGRLSEVDIVPVEIGWAKVLLVLVLTCTC